MAFTFNESKTLTDTNQIQIKNDPAGFISFSMKVGANPVQTVAFTQAEAVEIMRLFSFLTQSRIIDPV